MDEKTASFLHACKLGKREEVQRLLKEEMVDVNAHGSDKSTGLLLSIENGHREIAKFLIDNNADAMQKNENGFSPLSFACERSDVELARILLERGAEVNTVDSQLWSPLATACFNGNLKIVKLLLEHGAEYNIPTVDGDISLTLACKRGDKEVVELLVENGADVNKFYHGISQQYGWMHLPKVTNNRNKQLALDLLMGTELDARTMNIKTYTVWNPLFIASREGHIELIKWLFSKGADWKLQDLFGNGVLTQALENKRYDCIYYVSQRIISDFNAMFQANDSASLQKMVISWIDNQDLSILSFDSIKAFNTIDVDDPSSFDFLRQDIKAVDYFLSQDFVEKFQQDVIYNLNSQKDLLERGKVKLLSTYAGLTEEECIMTILPGPNYNEFSFWQLKDSIESENLQGLIQETEKANFELSEKRIDSLVLKYIKLFQQEIAQTLEIATTLQQVIQKRFSLLAEKLKQRA